MQLPVATVTATATATPSSLLDCPYKEAKSYLYYNNQTNKTGSLCLLLSCTFRPPSPLFPQKNLPQH